MTHLHDVGLEVSEQEIERPGSGPIPVVVCAVFHASAYQ
jgi:hypothetical protein